MSDVMPSSLPDIKQQLIEEKAKKIQAQSALDTRSEERALPIWLFDF